MVRCATAEAFDLVGRRLEEGTSATAVALRVLGSVERFDGECTCVVPPLGIEVMTDAFEVIAAVHLHSEGHEGFNAFPFSYEGLTFASSRFEVRRKLGVPIRSGVGRTGEWDVYRGGRNVLHLMYASDALSIALVTLFEDEEA